MATPKRRVSHSRTHKRKSEWIGGLSAPETTACPRCGEVIRNYTACGGCGYYRGRKILKTASESEKEA
jgi:large subunit ribosomal protein L32